MVRVSLFGGLEILGPTGAPIRPPTRDARELLAFLALEPDRRYPRDVVLGRLWGDRGETSARKALRNALWRLRGSLEEAVEPASGPDPPTVPAVPGLVDAPRRPGPGPGSALERAPEEPVFATGEQVGLGGGIQVDVADFRRAAAALPDHAAGILAPETVTALERAARLYRGNLLDGCYAPWVEAPREELRLVHLEVLEALVHHDRLTGRLARALWRGRELLRHDPMVERVHRELMLCHWLRGDRPRAVRCYRRCEAVLRCELELEPMPETRALLQRILDGRPPPPRGKPLRSGRSRRPGSAPGPGRS
jgi:DNA-binding SARP family transcriptional activator